MTRKEQLAWAGGFFEGEGHASKGVSFISKKTGKKFFYRRAMVNQKHVGPLRRFRRCVGFGVIGGPYQPKDKSRCPLYVWRTSSTKGVRFLLSLLRPYLSPRRIRQFTKTLEGA